MPLSFRNECLTLSVNIMSLILGFDWSNILYYFYRTLESFSNLSLNTQRPNSIKTILIFFDNLNPSFPQKKEKAMLLIYKVFFFFF